MGKKEKKCFQKLILTSLWSDGDVVVKELTKLHVHVRRVLGGHHENHHDDLGDLDDYDDNDKLHVRCVLGSS